MLITIKIVVNYFQEIISRSFTFTQAEKTDQPELKISKFPGEFIKKRIRKKNIIEPSKGKLRKQRLCKKGVKFNQITLYLGFNDIVISDYNEAE